MGKFEKGQYVRVLDASGAPRSYVKGEVGIVEELYGLDMVRLAGKSAGMFEYRFEPWVPKVGERVTTNVTARVNIERHWNEHFRRTEGDIINGALVVTSVAGKNYGGNIGLGNKDGRSLFFMPKSTLRPADPVPTTLAIDTGKTYSTDDGRKIGPIEKWEGEEDCFRSVGAGRGGLWRKNGTAYFAGSNDSPVLVAEWLDEPKASNDNGNVASLIGKSVTVQIAKPKFKVGDRVRFKQSYGLARVRGMQATVVSTDDWGIRIDCGPGEGVSTEHADSIELVSPAPTATAIVCLIENGQPKPSTTPHVHADEAKAGKEAARLAGVYKGKEFGVFVLKTTAQQAAPVYKHEWQRLAANGNKLLAIKELREIASLDLLSARRAVEVFIETAA